MYNSPNRILNIFAGDLFEGCWSLSRAVLCIVENSVITTVNVLASEPHLKSSYKYEDSHKTSLLKPSVDEASGFNWMSDSLTHRIARRCCGI